MAFQSLVDSTVWTIIHVHIRKEREMRLPQDRILHIGTELKDGKVNIVAEWQGELVRCKDCKWYGHLGCAIRIVDDSDKPSDNDYCSFGERSEE